MLRRFLYWICPNTERRFKAIAILVRNLELCRYPQYCLFRKNIYRLEWTSKCKERAEALVKIIRWTFWQLFIILLSLFASYRATVLFFVTIVFDEIRTKILCIHSKLIIACRRLWAIRKERLLEVYVCCVCCRSNNSKDVLFPSIMISLNWKKHLYLTISGKQSN